MPAGAEWICGGLVKCVLNWELCGVAGVEEVYIFWAFLFLHCLVMYYSVCGLSVVKQIGRVPFRCRHGHVTYLAQYLCLFQVRLLETEVFPHHRIHFTSLRDLRLPFCHLWPSSSARVFQTPTGNMHQHGWKRKFSGGWGAECTGRDGRVCCIYHKRHGVWQNDCFITIILFSTKTWRCPTIEK